MEARESIARAESRPGTGAASERVEGAPRALDPDERLPGDEPLPPPRRGLEHASLLALFLLGGLVPLALAFLVEPDPRGHGTHTQLGLPPCGLMTWTGVPCPGCGVTTSASLFLHGRLGDALATQPLGPLVALALPLAAVWALVQHARGRDLARELAHPRWRPRVALGLLLLLLAWGYKLAVVLG